LRSEDTKEIGEQDKKETQEQEPFVFPEKLVQRFERSHRCKVIEMPLAAAKELITRDKQKKMD
jgi:hypothetical protein